MKNENFILKSILDSQVETQNRLGQCSANVKQWTIVSVTTFLLFCMNESKDFKEIAVSTLLGMVILLYFIDTHFAYRERVHRLVYFSYIWENDEYYKYRKHQKRHVGIDLDSRIEYYKKYYPFYHSMIVLSSFIYYGVIIVSILLIGKFVCEENANFLTLTPFNILLYVFVVSILIVLIIICFKKKIAKRFPSLTLIGKEKKLNKKG